MNVAALLHDSPSNPPRKQPIPPPNDPPPRVSQQSPQTPLHALPHRPKSPAMGSLHPHQEQKSPWQHQDLQDDRDAHEEHWEKERRERADSGPLPSIRNTSAFETRPPSLPPKGPSKRDLDDMNFIRAAANARQMQQQQQHQPGSLAEILVLGPGPTPRPSSSTGRVQNTHMGSELGRERERTEWERLHPHPHSQQHRLPPPPHPHPVRSIPAPVPMHAPRDHMPFDPHRERRERDQQDAIRKDQETFARRHSQNPHPIPQHHAIIGRHGPPSRTSSAGLMEGRLSGTPIRADEHAFSFPPNPRDVNRESDHARMRRKEREKEKERLVREIREPQRAPITPVPEPQPRSSLIGAARHSLGVIEDIEIAPRPGINRLTGYDEPEGSQETVHVGTFIWPKSPFPFFFPERPVNKPRSYVATIYIPSGCLPLERPKQYKIWGGGLPARTKRGTRRVYTDDSDVFLCALHAGWVTWSGAQKAKEEGRDLEVQVRMYRCLGDLEGAAPGQPFLGIFPGGWGERYRLAAPKSHDSSHQYRKQRKGVNRGYDDAFAEPKKRLEELIGDGDESEDDDGRGLLSAGWGTSHDGSGIEIVGAKFVKATSRHFGLLNRRQRLAEYTQRRIALFGSRAFSSSEDSEMEQKTLVFGYGTDMTLSLGYKYNPKAFKRALLSDCSGHEDNNRPQKRRKVVRNGDSTDADEHKMHYQILVETAEDCYVFSRTEGAKPTFELAIKFRDDNSKDRDIGSDSQEVDRGQLPVREPSTMDTSEDQSTPRPSGNVPLPAEQVSPITPTRLEKVSSPPASPIDSIASTPTRDAHPSSPNGTSGELPVIRKPEEAPLRPAASAGPVASAAPEREVEEGELPEDEPVPVETQAAAPQAVTASPAVPAPSDAPSASSEKASSPTIAAKDQGTSQVEAQPPSPVEAIVAEVQGQEQQQQQNSGSKENLRVLRTSLGEDAIRFTDAGVEIEGVNGKEGEGPLFIKVERWRFGV